MSTKTEQPLKIAVLTLSDSRSLAQDKSGDALVELLQEAGHELVDRDLIPDDIYRMRALVSRWIADPGVQVILTTGGTGVTGRDSTPEAIAPLLDKQIEGFGELFRAISFTEIGPSTLQSRTIAGMANGKLIFCLPGSTGACRTAWNKILRPQLDISTHPCNFAAMFPRFLEGRES
ncbi:MAG: molybdenum cofactor biosynthesis protein B [Gammaproteobacteria bacterium]|nr:molybdenum cofactor biosynthesis protein B [Gammaproteobacteria bacterium]MBU1654939.1 molybdenum cofactor biosynthesis protein B [Gammaproteobacteria bacterium]MBU1960491.1 molybdenum cofactor biosynthesis protein B [Gammaproteobacteria bacterium]